MNAFENTNDFQIQNSAVDGEDASYPLNDGFKVTDAKTGVTVTMYRGYDGALVVQVNTDDCEDDPRIRVNLNDASVFDGHAESVQNYDLY